MGLHRFRGFWVRGIGQSTVGSGQFVSLEVVASNQNPFWEGVLLDLTYHNRDLRWRRKPQSLKNVPPQCLHTDKNQASLMVSYNGVIDYHAKIMVRRCGLEVIPLLRPSLGAKASVAPKSRQCPHRAKIQLSILINSNCVIKFQF